MELTRFLSLAGPYRGALIALALLNCINAGVALVVPAIGGPILEEIVNRGEAPQSVTVISLVAALLAVAILTFVTTYQSVRLGARVRSDLRRGLFDHVQRLPLEFHDRTGKGSMLALLTYESWRLGDFVAGTLAATPSRLLMAAGATGLMIRIDPTLAMIVPCVIPAYYLGLKIVGRRIRQTAYRQQEAEARAIELAEEAIEMVPATKAFTREYILNERYGDAAEDVVQTSIRLGRMQALIDPAMGLIAALAAIAILLLAGQSIGSGSLSHAELFTFILYAILLSRPVSALAHLYGEFQLARGTLSRMSAVLDETPENLEATASPIASTGDITFTDITFKFSGRPQLLKGVNLTIRQGETIALLGANGSGKSALISLLMRYYSPQGGSIEVGGTDIATLKLADWRRQIGLVPQLPYLFNGTVCENIAFGSLTRPSADEIARVARLAQADRFIAALPDGYDTVIGDRGTRLSGGQRQRIALARALIKDPPIMIFDEATAMFDESGEADFLLDCAEALAGRTTILITHRPALLALADRRIELVDGRARERTKVRSTKVGARG